VTVAELIAALRSMPPDRRVVYYDSDYAQTEVVRVVHKPDDDTVWLEGDNT
jgi:hypothetical protein